MNAPLNERFERHFQKGSPDECWPWTGGRQKTGHARFSISAKKNVAAYRFSYERFIGPIPSGLLVRHRCDNPLCVNPHHLIPGTQKQNLQDMVERGRSTKGRYPIEAASKRLAQTHCKRDHPLSGDNLTGNGIGGRACKTCRSLLAKQRSIR